MIYELRVRVILYDIKSGEHRNTLSYPIRGQQDSGRTTIYRDSDVLYELWYENHWWTRDNTTKWLENVLRGMLYAGRDTLYQYPTSGGGHGWTIWHSLGDQRGTILYRIVGTIIDYVTYVVGELRGGAVDRGCRDILYDMLYGLSPVNKGSNAPAQE